MDRSWRFWIDRGGTFTDVIGQVASGPDAGSETSLKLLSASAAYPDAAVEAMRRILGAGPGEPFPAARVESITSHGTSQRRGVRSAPTTRSPNRSAHHALSCASDIAFARPPPTFQVPLAPVEDRICRSMRSARSSV